MFRILTTYNIHISTLLPPHALAPITQLLDRAAHLHAARLYPQSGEARREIRDTGVLALERRAQKRVAAACGRVHVCAGLEGAGAEVSGGSGAREEGAAEREEERSGQHDCGRVVKLLWWGSEVVVRCGGRLMDCLDMPRTHGPGAAMGGGSLFGSLFTTRRGFENLSIRLPWRAGHIRFGY